ncbi:MAG: arginase family protein [Candidatus Thorarchaeota archaeon]
MTLREELNGFLRLPDRFFGIPEPEDQVDPDVGVLGVPYDLTSSYAPGCRFGPDAIRRATTAVRSHSQPPVAGESRYVRRPLLTESLTLEDIGDLEVDLRLPEAAMYDISDAVYRLAPHESHLLFLGGDHFITYPLLKGLTRGRPGVYGLVWFDAHADFYADYGGYKLSHATSLRRIVTDGIVSRNNVIAHDLRAALHDQVEELFEEKEPVVRDLDSFRESVQELAQRVDYIYVTVDLDVLRPEVVPGVSHPESGGLTPEELFKFLRACFETGSVRYADVVELNPLVDHSGLAAITARDIVKEILAGFALQKTL